MPRTVISITANFIFHLVYIGDHLLSASIETVEIALQAAQEP